VAEIDAYPFWLFIFALLGPLGVLGFGGKEAHML